MKVLMISPGLFPLPSFRGGGVESHLYPLVNALAKLGCEVHLVSDIISEKYFDDNVVVHRVYSLPHSFTASFGGWGYNLVTGGLQSVITSLRLLLKKQHFDIIHSHEAISIIAISRFRKIMSDSYPLVLTVHSPSIRLKAYSNAKEILRRAFFKIIVERAWRSSDHLIVLSKESQRELMELFNIQSEKITLIPHGVNTDFFKSDIDDADCVKKKYGIEEPYCLFVGWPSEKKGVQFLLKALVNTKMHCVIVGGGPYLRRLKKMALELNIANKVTFTGNIHLKELRLIYAGASVFVLPSLSEASAISPLEAMASGVPATMTDVPGAEDIIINKYNGFIIRRGDVEDLKSKLQLFYRDDVLLERMKENARRTAEEKFSWLAVAKKTKELYERLLVSS